MPKKIHLLTVFVSGPSDVEAEKAAIKPYIDEMNQRLEDNHGVTFRIVGWPDSVRPGVHTDPQAEINAQIGNPDIYIGIVGSRMGTKTRRYGSGTEEEFKVALNRFRADSTSIRVLFYFNTATGDVFSIDMEQLKRVRQFREGLPEQGVIYRDFSDVLEFGKMLRKHLEKLVADEWAGDRWRQVSPPDGSPEPGRSSESPVQPEVAASALLAAARESEATDHSDDDDEGEEDEPGLLDYAASAGEAGQLLTDAMENISKATNVIGDRMRVRTTETDEIAAARARLEGVGGSREQQELLGKGIAVVNGAAADLETFVADMLPNVDQYRRSNRAFFQAHSALLRLGADNNKEENCRSLGALIATIVKSRESILSFQDSITKMPALTAKFRKTQKRAASVVGAVVAEMSISLEEVEKLLEQIGCESDVQVANKN